LPASRRLGLLSCRYERKSATAPSMCQPGSSEGVRHQVSTRDRTVGDRSLVARAAWGDVEAFTKLVRTPSSLVYRVALRMLGGEDAQDVSQELWVRVWRNIKGFRGESVCSTWLHRITINMCLSMRQRESPREGREYSGEGAPYLPEPLGGDADPEGAAAVNATDIGGCTCRMP
jgi:Sigma-70 region 2